MDKYRYTFERKVDPDFEANDFDVDRRGERTFRLKTGADDDFYSRINSSRRDHFNEKFIEKFNEATDHNLDHNNIYVKRELRKIHEGLRRGNDKIHFEVTPQMQ
jgi:hypothetical protein